MLLSAYRPIPQPADIRSGRRVTSSKGGIRAKAEIFVDGNHEPSLAEVMADPIVHRLMARDGVGLDSLNSLIDQVRGRLL